MSKPEHELRYPLYIVSKGRHESMHSSRSLTRMKVPHYIAIEPHDHDNYVEALNRFGLNDYATLLILPFSNHGDGPGRARNWCWDHAKDVLCAARFWVADDNISDWYRLHKNKRIRVESGSLFRACEDFNDRFENVPMSGLQYRFFCAPNQKYPPYVANCRIYSCALIDTSGKHRFRGRYNEDTALSLDILKDGDCTIQFNFFLQSKDPTQALKGGNTDEFYHSERLEEGKEGRQSEKYKAAGTINKSQMLVDMHPDVATVVWRYDRWHHHVDYSSFKKNKLILKKDVDLSKYTKVDNYGLKLIENYGLDND